MGIVHHREEGRGLKSYEFMEAAVDRYLQEAREAAASIQDAEERLARCEARLGLLGAGCAKLGLGQPVGPAARGDAMAEAVQDLWDLRRELAESVAHHGRALEAARTAFPACDPARYALWLHEVERMTWHQAARRVGYSASWCKQVGRERAVRSAYEAIPEADKRRLFPEAQPRII